jgi:hypothetical protein
LGAIFVYQKLGSARSSGVRSMYIAGKLVRGEIFKGGRVGSTFVG